MLSKYDWHQPLQAAVVAWMVFGCLNAADSCLEPAAADEKAISADDYFERHVRPLLLNRCVECHGPETQEAGLRLDSPQGFAQGGDSGPLVDSKVPEASRFLNAIRYDDDLRMPPDGKLPAQELQVLEDWILAGASWPSSESSNSVGSPDSEKNGTSHHHSSIDLEHGRQHWSFQTVSKPQVPSIDTAEFRAWCQTDVDRFVLDALLKAGLEPSAAADRRTLIRRATADLHGLVPTPEEIREFEADPRPDAFRYLVDRLLASPRYGERWGRYWLDVARYSDTRGYVRLKENPNYPSAWTYRDYVIRAFNEDLPWNRFIVQQLAADCDPETSRPEDLAALGFLTLGQRFINSQNDIIDDRIDVVTRGFLGLTVTCARCHDHKYDPISMDDYYGMHGIFASSREPDIPALILPPAQAAEYSAYLTELKRRETVFRDFLQTQRQKLEAMFRGRTAEYLMAARTEKVQANFLPVMFLIDASKDLNPVVVQRWARLLQRTRGKNHPILEPWHRFSRITVEDSAAFLTAADAVMTDLERDIASGTLTINSVVLNAVHRPFSSLREVADVYQELQNRTLEESEKASDWSELQEFFLGPESPSSVVLDDVDDFMFADASTQNLYHEQQRIVEDWIAQPGAAPHAHTLEDSSEPHDSPIFLRGNASNPGRLVSRQFLRVLAPSEAGRYSVGSGRLELARDIASPGNPLTARVAVNRIWLHHFGTGLVPTAGDFGTRGEQPVHRELLDYLAYEFVTHGWSVKTIHRLLMNSSVYQQVSNGSEFAETADPQNNLYWKMNRRRMDWESMRDSLLFVSGELDLKIGGPSEPLFTGGAAASKRRSVYGFVDRQSLPSILRTFDFATPEQSAPLRHQTSVPQQALFLMNSTFMRDRAIAMAKLIEQEVLNGSTQSSPGLLAELAWLRAYGRPPEPAELQSLLEYISQDEVTSPDDHRSTDSGMVLSRLEEFCQVLLMSNEFQFID